MLLNQTLTLLSPQFQATANIHTYTADSMSSPHPHQVHSAAAPGGVWRLARSWPPRCGSTYQDLRHLHAPLDRTSGSYINHSNLPNPAGTEQRHRHVPTPDGGLSEELILKNLKTRSCREDEEEGGVCVVCQDDMRRGNDAIGVVDCGHEYHACWIARWLREKNVCPLCKAIALHVDDD